MGRAGSDEHRARGIDAVSSANASGSPGNGGRHQQVGGPPGCGQSAPSTGPATRAASRLTSSSSASGGLPGFQSKTRCGALESGTCSSGGCRDEDAAARSSPGRRAYEGDVFDICEALVGVRWLELAERSHLRGRREQARLDFARVRSSPGVGSEPKRSSSRSTRLTCACASGVSSQMHRAATPCRPAASIA